MVDSRAKGGIIPTATVLDNEAASLAFLLSSNDLCKRGTSILAELDEGNVHDDFMPTENLRATVGKTATRDAGMGDVEMIIRVNVYTITGKIAP